jgi:hypothetical protein
MSIASKTAPEDPIGARNLAGILREECASGKEGQSSFRGSP